jgi:ankyrin repeat protein
LLIRAFVRLSMHRLPCDITRLVLHTTAVAAGLWCFVAAQEAALTEKREGKANEGLRQLLRAAYGERIDEFKAVIARDKGVAQAEDEFGQTALHYRHVAEHPQFVELLVNAGAVVDKRDKNGSTPLHLAAGSGNLSGAKSLIAAGADIHAREYSTGEEDDGFSVLDLAAASGGNEALVDLLIKKGAKVVERKKHVTRSALHVACAGLGLRGDRSNGKVIALLMAQVKDINLRDGFGQTPLYRAADGLAVDTIKYLVETYPEIDMNAQDYKGDTPLHRAADYPSKRHGKRCAAAIQLLLKHGADRTVKNRKGQTPLDVAIASKEEIVIKAFGGE